MNLKFLWAIVGVTTFTLGAFSWHYLQLTPIEDPLYEYALLTGGLAIGLGIFWVPYSLLIAYMVVPKADAWIAPHQPFDNLIERHYRALDYSGACTFRWINRRTLDFDCRHPTCRNTPSISDPLHNADALLYLRFRKRRGAMGDGKAPVG